MVKKKLQNIFYEILKVDEIDRLNRKNCAEWDSLNHIKLISTIEAEFDIEFDIEDVILLNSFDDILSKVKENVNI